jgi:hypothetical protein
MVDRSVATTSYQAASKVDESTGPRCNIVLQACDRSGVFGRKHRLLQLLSMDVLSICVKQMLDLWFESEPLKCTLATDAVIGAMVSPTTPGSGYVCCLLSQYVEVKRRYRFVARQLCAATPRNGRGRRCPRGLGLSKRWHGRCNNCYRSLSSRPGSQNQSKLCRSTFFAIISRTTSILAIGCLVNSSRRCCTICTWRPFGRWY